jgi:hypothetical protein
MGQLSWDDLVNGVIPDASDFNTPLNAIKNRINNGMEQDNLAAGSVSTAKIVNGAVTAVKVDQTDDFTWTGTHDFSGGTVTGTGIDGDQSLAGSTVQVVNVQSGAVATGTTVMPHDDTIPQKTEGDEYMTLAITPKSATNKLKIEIVFLGESSSGDNMPVALFQDDTANALAGVMNYATGASNYAIATFTHYMTAGTTSATTFKVRSGNEGSGTLTFNGKSGARKLGGVMASSITITEIKV